MVEAVAMVSARTSITHIPGLVSLTSQKLPAYWPYHPVEAE